MSLFHKKETKTFDDNEITSLVAGDVIDITQVNDPVFASESMGVGVAILPKGKILVSPVDGEIIMTFPTKHAIGIRSKEGIELLIHIGIDTVNLHGMGFKTFVSQGDQIHRGDKIVKVDFDYIKEQGFDSYIMVIVTQPNGKEVHKILGQVKALDRIIEVY